jgi:CRP/FNR family cyclic AMP-dependent transcriptional regulator
LQSLEKQGILRLAYNQIQVIDLERLCAFGQEQI